MTKTTAIYAGSFDPITNGHIDIIEKASRLFDVKVLIANNSGKRCTYTVTERKKMIKLLGYNVVSTDGFVSDYDGDVLIRGLRAKDYTNEIDLYHTNKHLGKETVYFMPDLANSLLSSTMIKELGWRAKAFVPLYTYNMLCREEVVKLVTHEDVRSITCYDDKPYHNWVHILSCLQEAIKHTCNGSDDRTKLLSALLYHDVEDLSSDIYRQHETLIHATYHDVYVDAQFECWSDLMELIHDIDLYILATYANGYPDNVRQEYAPEKWVEGRTLFLNTMLKRDIIFLTDEYAHCDIRARNNMTNELNKLNEEK